MGKKYKIYRSKLTDDTNLLIKNDVGFWNILKDRLLVTAGDGNLVEIMELQQEGRKRLGVNEFLTGFNR
jgi:methionyl-tRNA formyltransferase